MMQKIEHAKNLIIKDNLTLLTEVAYRLNYSSVAHLSTQFKILQELHHLSSRELLPKEEKLQIKNKSK